MEPGSFVISLDLELMWGVLDVKTVKEYGDSIIGGRESLPKTLKLFEEFNISATFSTVGFLFSESKKELFSFIPVNKPTYNNMDYSPYPKISSIGKNELDDPYFYGMSLIDLLGGRNHEISTHTFCHYYCLEDGQNINQFDQDIDSAKKIAAKKGFNINTIIFPRNQFNLDYIEVLKKHKIIAYRGNANYWFYKSSKYDQENLLKRFFRFLDSYVNISGHNTYTNKEMRGDEIINIPSSSFLRPFNNKLKYFEKIRFNRIKNSMTEAAINNKTYHLWWHPHNFGMNQTENLYFLKKILMHYQSLNKKYNFQSKTMTKLAGELLNL